MRIITVGENDAGQRLDKFLSKLMPTCPKSLLYKLIRKKDIRLNGARCKGTEQLRPGDTVRIFAPEECFASRKPVDTHAAAVPLHICYEDAQILIVYKPKGLDVHSGSRSGAPTLLSSVLRYLTDTGAYDPAAEQTFAPALCNRIDRNTEGLVIAAKTAAALRSVNAAIRERSIVKQYLAVTAAPLPEPSDTCTAWLRRSGTMVEVADTCRGREWKEIRTAYRVLAENGGMCLTAVTLLTGRTHQIRAHLAHLHAPILGDPKYGEQHADVESQCLCAFALRFPQIPELPAVSGRTVTAPVPAFVHRYFPDITPETLYSAFSR